MLVIDITSLTEEQKAKLRGAIKFFNGDRNNIPVCVKVDEELKSCGSIYCNNEILEVFKDIVGENNIKI